MDCHHCLCRQQRAGEPGKRLRTVCRASKETLQRVHPSPDEPWTQGTFLAASQEEGTPWQQGPPFPPPISCINLCQLTPKQQSRGHTGQAGTAHQQLPQKSSGASCCRLEPGNSFCGGPGCARYAGRSHGPPAAWPWRRSAWCGEGSESGLGKEGCVQVRA